MAENGKEGIVIVSAGLMQVPAIKAAREMGLYVVATDRDPAAPGFEFCDHKVVLDSKDAAGHVEFAKANRERFNIKGAFAGSDVAITVAAITDALGLPGIAPEVAARSNNKALMKERWIRDGIPTPFGAEASTFAEASAILGRIGFPAIVKAVDNAASRGSVKIESRQELPAAFESAKSASRSNTAVVEQYVVGAEQSVETIVWQGHHYHVGMADRQFGYHPFHIETAHFDPSELPESTQRSIYEVVDAAADSLGIDFGPAKADMILTRDGPMILEMPARLSGGFHSQYTTPLSSGKHPIKAVLGLAVGRPLDESQLRQSKHLVAVCSGIFPPPGLIKAVHGLDAARSLPGVAEVFVTRGPGQRIDPYRDNGNRVCWVITLGADRAEALANFRAAEQLVQFELEG
jgi:biotin carboxylase